MRRLALPLLLVALAGCDRDFMAEPFPLLPVQRFVEDGRPLAVNAGIARPERIVIRSQEEWAAAWARIQGPQAASLPLPPVDFSREMVVVGAMGTRPTGGFSILVEEAYDRGDAIVVRFRATEPGARCVVTTGLTSPADAARLPRHDRAVVFEEILVTRDC